MIYIVVNDVEIVTKTRGVLKFLKGQKIKLTVQSAQRLIETGKIRLLNETKQRQDRFIQVFDNAVHTINKNYKSGAIEYVCKKYPERWQQSLEAENRLNVIWDEGKNLEAFQKAVEEWKEMELEMIKLFHPEQN